MKKDGRPRPVDLHVGSRIRLRRTLLAMSQERLGDALDLTFQQVQKYERGVNRVGASRLFDLSRVLDVPISFFFDDMPETMTGAGAALLENQAPFGDDIMSRRETLALVRAYYQIADPSLRKKVFNLIKSMGPAEG
jgi:transcriptional regulator with XRE-family HTH domain